MPRRGVRTRRGVGDLAVKTLVHRAQARVGVVEAESSCDASMFRVAVAAPGEGAVRERDAEAALVGASQRRAERADSEPVDDRAHDEVDLRL